MENWIVELIAGGQRQLDVKIETDHLAGWLIISVTFCYYNAKLYSKKNVLEETILCSVMMQKKEIGNLNTNS